jgi:molybdopterin-containing oxidoreductase family iron-sulfur binding subunit
MTHNGLEPPEGMSRRDFVTLLGASMALAGLGGCVREPDRRILPYVSTPSGIVPGVPLHYATSMVLDGHATGLLVTSREGRPVKIEGNPSHPASLGASGALEQASLLQLYDPQRAPAPRAGRRRTTLGAARAALAPSALGRRVGVRGEGLQLLLEPTSSPLVVELLDRVRTRYPGARVSFFAPLASPAQLEAAQRAFGAPLLPHHDFRHADIVVALDADLLAQGPFHLRHAFDFAQHRAESREARLYVGETAPSPTGTLADRRVALAPSDVVRVAAALYSGIAAPPAAGAPDAAGSLPPALRDWVTLVARELAAHRGSSLVVAGERQPADVHLLVAALNDALRNVGRTVWYAAPVIVEAGEPSHDLARFATGLDSDTDTLVILDVNAAYAAPGDLDLAQRIRAVPNSIYLGPYDDETARLTTWHLPASHYLESWGDARAYDGTLSLVQPLIAPLHESLSVPEVLAALAGDGAVSVHDLLRQHWRSVAPAGAKWEESLRLGFADGSALARVTPAVRQPAVADALRQVATVRRAADVVELSFTAGVVHDGRFANNAWLQELPDPVTKLTWDNAAQLSPALAAREHLQSGDTVRLQRGARSVALPALVVPGHADDSVTIAVGYGRTGAEAVARGVGVSASALRSADAPFVATDVRLARIGGHRPLAITQQHWSLEGRAESVLGEAAAAASTAGSMRRPRRPLTLYEPPAPPSTGFGADQWAMTIDLDRCTGCSACVVACQSENNIPVVGRDGVLDSREMHWLRIDRYVQDGDAAPRFVTQPMLCQQCEKAPCEYVCPVNATVHSDDGLNEMAYNRCVGTRFCSNNCPYKVRRFNWFDYNQELAETERMAKNPEVTIRARGVMEKCTFCVQRIRRAQADAELAGAGETGPVVTACQQACPTRAIVFGSLTNPAHEVTRLQDDPRRFAALGELGTLPRVTYLRREVRSTPASTGEPGGPDAR